MSNTLNSNFAYGLLIIIYRTDRKGDESFSYLVKDLARMTVLKG